MLSNFLYVSFFILSGALPTWAEGDKKNQQLDPETNVFSLQSGNSKAPFVIRAFTAFTCPHCRIFHTEDMIELKKIFAQGKWQIVFEPVPIDAQSLRALMALHTYFSESLEDRVNLLFIKQEDWVPTEDIEKFNANLARVLEIKVEQVESASTNKDLGEKMLSRWFYWEEKYQLDGTPIFILEHPKTGATYKIDGYAPPKEIIAELQKFENLILQGKTPHFQKREQNTVAELSHPETGLLSKIQNFFNPSAKGETFHG